MPLPSLRDIENVDSWPLVHLGELGFLQSGVSVLLDRLYLLWLGRVEQLTKAYPTDQVQRWFKDVVPQAPGIPICEQTLRSPVIAVRQTNGNVYGLDGAARVRYAVSEKIAEMRVMILDEMDVREFAAVDPDFGKPAPDASTDDKTLYRMALHSLSRHSTRMKTRPHLESNSAQEELVLGPARPAPQVEGRPYLIDGSTIDFEVLFQKGAGRRAVPGLAEVDAALGRVVSTLWSHLKGIKLESLIAGLNKTEIIIDYKSEDGIEKQKINLVMPQQRVLEKYLTLPARYVRSFIIPKSVSFVFPKDIHVPQEHRHMILQIHDLLTLKLQIQHQHQQLKSYVRKMERGKNITHQDRQGVVFGHSKHPQFIAHERSSVLPGYFEPLVLCWSTGLAFPRFYADTRFLMGPALVASCACPFGAEQTVSVPFAISFLQALKRNAMMCLNHFDFWWNRALALHEPSERERLGSLAVLVLRGGLPLPFEPRHPEQVLRPVSKPTAA